MESRGSLFVFLFISVLFVCDVYGQVATLCRPNERFLSCGGLQKTCADPAPVCAAVCRQGCYCDNDEVRNGTGHCVKLADCPSISPTHLHTSEPRTADAFCPENEEYRFCQPCNRTCDNPNPMCPAQCARGCFCKDELVRDRDGRCVRVEECGLRKNENSNYIRPIPYQLTCGPHQLYKDCQKCERTCSSPNPVCGDTCNAGCFCEEGYLKAPSGKCVKLEECPKAEVTMGAHETSVEDCSNDEVYLSCGWCEPSCWDPRPECPPGVCTRGCLCRPPLLRHHSGHCVEDKHCAPQKCTDPGEEFVCRYGCEARCDSHKCPSRPRRCVLGCHCKLGLVRDAGFKCVTPDKCIPRFQPFKDIPVNPLPFPVRTFNVSNLLATRPNVFRLDFIDMVKPKPFLEISAMPKIKEIDFQPKTKISDLGLGPKAFFEFNFVPKFFKESILSNIKNDEAKTNYEAALSKMNQEEGKLLKLVPRKGLASPVADNNDTIESSTARPVELESTTNIEVTNSSSSEEVQEYHPKVQKIDVSAFVSNFLNDMKKMLPPMNITKINYPV